MSGGVLDTSHVEQREWAGRIAAAWRRTSVAVLETGQLILDAKAALPHGAFLQMVRRELPFGEREAQMLMRIASDHRLANPNHGSFLPASWRTLYELTRLDDETFDSRLTDGTINPAMQRRDAEAARRVQEHAAPEVVEAVDRGEVTVSAAAELAKLPVGEQLDVLRSADPRAIAQVARERAGAINGSRAIMASRSEPADSLDYFPTPPWATRALVEDVLMPMGERLEGALVWEPACGEGHIAGVLEEYGAEVAATDVFDYSAEGREPPGWRGTLDFLAGSDDERERAAARILKPRRKPDWIITNPPFAEEKTLAFALAARMLVKRGVALFVRQQWLEGVDRYERLFGRTPPERYAQFAERVNLCKGRWDPEGSTATAYGWMIWRPTLALGRLATLMWIPPGRRVGRSRPDDIARFTAHPVLGVGQTAVGGAASAPHSTADAATLSPEGRGEVGPVWLLDRPASKAEAEPILRARYDGANGAALAAELRIPMGTLRGWVFRLGLTDRGRNVARGAAMVAGFNADRQPQGAGARP